MGNFGKLIVATGFEKLPNLVTLDANLDELDSSTDYAHIIRVP